MAQQIFIKQTESTNSYIKQLIKSATIKEGAVVYTDFQTAGKGQQGNSWESEKGKNLLFSMLLHPTHIAIDQQFILSQIVCLGIKQALVPFCDGIEIKWPNDIYFGNKKLGGILIENSLRGGQIASCIIGIGLNINQEKFVSNAPNPISIRQITGKKISRKTLLTSICAEILHYYTDKTEEEIHSEYYSALFRKDGYYPYRTQNESFNAKIHSVYPDGRLVLETHNGEQKSFYFKEVEFVI